MYYRGKMFGFVHLYSGQEACSTGAIKGNLRKDDYICSTYRDHVHALSKGCSADSIMAELFGKATGVCRGQGGSMHMFSQEYGVLGGYAFIGEGIPVSLGAAFKVRYMRDVLGDESADQVRYDGLTLLLLLLLYRPKKNSYPGLLYDHDPPLTHPIMTLSLSRSLPEPEPWSPEPWSPECEPWSPYPYPYPYPYPPSHTPFPPYPNP